MAPRYRGALIHPRWALLSGVLGVAALGPAPARALDPSRRVTQHSIDVWSSGLPRTYVKTMAQTRDGYLWLGTEEGLIRFDGVRFTLFDPTSRPPLPANHVSALHEDRRGVFWIGTYSAGLFTGGSRGFERPALPADLSKASVTALAEDAAGALWVGTTRGLYRVQGGQAELFTTREGLPHDVVSCLLVDPSDTLWVGTDGGVVRRSAGGWKTFGVAQGLPTAGVTALAHDRAGRIWVGTVSGLALGGAGGSAFGPAPAAWGTRGVFIRALRADRDGVLWVGTDAGLRRIDQDRSESLRQDNGLPSNLVNALAEDHEGSLWVALRGSGLVRLKDTSFITWSSREGLPSDQIEVIAPARQGGSWITTQGGHVVRLDPEGRVWPLPAGKPVEHGDVRALHEDADGTLWLGTWLGLYQWSGGQWQRRLEGLAVNVRTILRDRGGALWVGNDSGGLIRHTPSSTLHFTTRNGLPGDQVRALREDQQGNLWIGTYGGLSRYREGTFTNYTEADGLPSRLVRTLHEDAAGVLWIGTYAGGLARLKEGRFAGFTRKQGLAEDVIYQILEDDFRHLWMSGNKGIQRVSKQELDGMVEGRLSRLAVVTADEGDGLANRECSGSNPAGWKAPDGRLWFGTVGGVVSVDPARRRLNPHAPPVHVEALHADGAPVPLSGEPALSPEVRQIEFQFTALSLFVPQRVRFRYKLDGYDPDWVDAGERRSAHYGRLPAGRYTFRVVACNNDEVWNDQGASLAFYRQPALVETWAFRAGVLGLLALGAWSVHRLRVWQLRLRQAQLKAEVEEAVARVRVLDGLLPICAWCKKIRDDKGYWNQLESYISGRSRAEFSHGICPDCMTTVRAGKPTA